MYDLLITNGLIIDGTGEKRYKGDIGIKDNRIKLILKDNKSDKENADILEGKKVIDVSGKIISPGFIDLHSHSDILGNPRGESKIRQGITTELTGNCGVSAMPTTNENYHKVENYVKLFTPLTEHFDGLSKDINEFSNWINKRGTTFDYLPLIGHGNLRIAVMGDENRDPADNELEKMKKLLGELMSQGAWGLSSGLIYPPGSFAKKEELIELCKVVSYHNGIYTTHIRNEGNDIINALNEQIDIAKASGVKLNISHLKVISKDNWGKSEKVCETIERGIKEGLKITCDQYPYYATSTSLNILVGKWLQDGGGDRMIERLKDKSLKNRIDSEIKENLKRVISPEGVLIASAQGEELEEVEGMTLKEISEEWGINPVEAVKKLIIKSKGKVKAVYFSISEEDVINIMGKPFTAIGSDGYPLSVDGKYRLGRPHPRTYGAFPRVFSKYVREEKIINIEEAVRKMTSLPAKALGLKDRGIITVGKLADIVIFDEEEIADTSTFENPHSYPKGLEYVIKNGGIVVEKGKQHEVYLGKVITK